MTSPNYRWRDDHALPRDPAILSFRHSADLSDMMSVSAGSSSGSKSANAISSPNKPSTSPQNRNTSNNSNNYAQRERGVIEKLLHSYGFIQCCDRQARLFFHYSEFGGDADTMRTGELVEFHESADKRTGKPIAVSVVRVPNPKNAAFEIISEKPANGIVLAEAKAVKNKGSEGEAPSLMDGMGRVAYEQSGETFFLPFGLEDIELTGQKIQAGEHIEFFISTDEKNGNIRARHIKLVKPETSNDTYQGVVCTLKDNYGFIERADVVREIFFHFSEFQEDINTLALGDDVQFAIQTRNNKEVAVNVQKLELGTVVFEDIGVEKRRGKILKTLKSNMRQTSDPLAGRIVYETLEGSIEIPFGDRDQLGDYTLMPDDIVEFNIATDRRDKLQRATNIALSEDTFLISKEKREKGYVATMKEGYGFIRCADREGRMFFHYSELLDSSRELKQQQELEFTVVLDGNGRQVAVRIRYLPKGTIAVEQYLPEKFMGTVEKEAGVTHTNPAKGLDPESPGIILYDMNGTKQTILFTVSVVDGNPPKLGDKVEFQICECRKNNTKNAVSVHVCGSTEPTSTPVGKELGYIACLRDGGGSIETSDHEKELSFQFGNLNGDKVDLNIGDEVEVTLSDKSVVTGIRRLKLGTISSKEVLPGILEGKVVRARSSDPSDPFGLIQTSAADKGGDEGAVTSYSFGIASMSDKQETLPRGESVRFQVAVVHSTGKRYAANVAASRRYLHARIEGIKGQTAFLAVDEDGKKVSFRIADILGGGEVLAGDEVEYIVTQAPNGRYYAANVRKISERQRPERLISRLKSIGDDFGPKMIVTRQPRGPDGTKGFKQPRKPWKLVTV